MTTATTYTWTTMKIRRRKDFNDAVYAAVEPSLRRHKRFSEARDYIVDWKLANPSGTLAQLKKAVKADGTILAALAAFIQQIAPLVLQILALFMVP